MRASRKTLLSHCVRNKAARRRGDPHCSLIDLGQKKQEQTNSPIVMIRTPAHTAANTRSPDEDDEQGSWRCSERSPTCRMDRIAARQNARHALASHRVRHPRSGWRLARIELVCTGRSRRVRIGANRSIPDCRAAQPTPPEGTTVITPAPSRPRLSASSEQTPAEPIPETAAPRRHRSGCAGGGRAANNLARRPPGHTIRTPKDSNHQQSKEQGDERNTQDTRRHHGLDGRTRQ